MQNGSEEPKCKELKKNIKFAAVKFYTSVSLCFVSSFALSWWTAVDKFPKKNVPVVPRPLKYYQTKIITYLEGYENCVTRLAKFVWNICRSVAEASESNTVQ